MVDSRMRSPGPRAAWLTLVSAALAAMMDGVDATGLAVANPVLARDLRATLPQLEALTVGYMLAMAMALVPVGMLADRVGHRRVFLAGLGAFMLTSLLVGVSGSATEMAAWRVPQGVAGAMLAASALALLRHAFPPERFKIAMGLLTGGLALAALVGPFVGGALVEYVHWRVIFFVNLPIGALAFVLAVAFAPGRTAGDRPRRFDLAGTVLLTLAVFGLVSGINRAPVDGWLGGYPAAALTAAAALLVAFWARERAAASDALLPLALFRGGRLVVGLAVILAAGLAHFGTAFYYALYLQQARGLSPVEAGAGLLPLIGLVALGAPASGVLNRRFGARPPIVAGLLALTAGLGGIAATGLESGFGVLVPFLLAMGLGIGLAVPTAAEVVIGAAPGALAGVAAGLQQTVLMISGCLGAAIFGSIIAAGAPEFAEHAVASRHLDGYLAGFGHAALVGAALTLLAAVASAVTLRRARHPAGL